MAHICSLPIRLFLVVVLHRQGKWISAQSSGVTDSLMAELDHTVKTESSQMQYFVTTDARLLIYQTETVRNMQIQQIHGIWCHVLRANDDCSSVLFFSWNVTTVPPKSETSYSIKEIVHFVIVSPRFKPEVSNDAIRNEFDQMLIKQAIWGVNAVDTGNSDPFALIDSVWMYSNDDVKTQLLEELKRLWQRCWATLYRAWNCIEWRSFPNLHKNLILHGLYPSRWCSWCLAKVPRGLTRIKPS